jgi:hypothetical protein
MKRHPRAGGLIACLLAFSAGAALAKAAPGPAPGQVPAAVRPAIWRTYDMIVDFQRLPRTYTCDQLWYEFRGILLRLGAPPAGINILPYDCSPTPQGDLKSPHVEVRFQLPFLLQSGIKGAPIHAVEGTVRLAPGKPKILQASDCELLRQIRETMLASMPVKVDAAHLDCSAAPSRAGKFWVSVRLPMLAGAAAAAPGHPLAPR